MWVETGHFKTAHFIEAGNLYKIWFYLPLVSESWSTDSWTLNQTLPLGHLESLLDVLRHQRRGHKQPCFVELRFEKKDIHQQYWQIKHCDETTKQGTNGGQVCSEDSQWRAHREDDVWAKILGEQAGSSTGVCREDTMQSPQTGNQ